MPSRPTPPRGSRETIPTLKDAIEIARRERFLAVVATVRADGSIQSSVVNVGLLAHPIVGEDVLAFVTYGRVKLENLRRRPQVTVTFRSGGEWVALEGLAEIIGPDDVVPEIDDERLRLLRREVFTAAGGEHDDWSTYDRVMAEEGRSVVLIGVTRMYSNRPRR